MGSADDFSRGAAGGDAVDAAPHRLAPGLAARLLALAAAAWPEECCGLLLGTRASDDGGDGIAGIVPAANVAADPRRRFEIDPAVLIAAQRAARHGGPPVIGHYHSHPHGPAAPSAADRAEARGDGALWAIVAVAPPMAQAAACGDRDAGAPDGGGLASAARPAAGHHQHRATAAVAGVDMHPAQADIADDARAGSPRPGPDGAGCDRPGPNGGGQVRVWRDDPAGFALFSAPAPA